MTGMEVEEVKKLGLKLMENSKAAILTTLDADGFPITRAMFNLRNKEQFPEFSEFFKNQQNPFTSQHMLVDESTCFFLPIRTLEKIIYTLCTLS